MRKNKLYILVILLLALLSACSTTKNLPEDQVLYTGQKKLIVENESDTPTSKEAMNEVRSALAKAPNNSLFGSSRYRHPFAFGLWIYNAFVDAEGGIGRWIFRNLAADPVYISTVNPELRSRVATNLLRDYGLFNGTVDHEVIPNEKNDKKAKVQFYVSMGKAYYLDSIMYRNFPAEGMEMINRSNQSKRNGTLLRKGDQFSVINLENERQRISNIFRNRGYYYFRPDYIGYLADTTRVSGLVDLRVQPKAGIPFNATKQWHIGSISLDLIGVYGEEPNDSIEYENLKIRFHDKLKLRPKVAKGRFRIQEGQLYSQRRSAATQQKFAELGIFRFTEMRFLPRDTTQENSILDLTVRSGFDLPYNSEFEVNLATKSNDYAGPGIAYGITKRNVFHGGETFSIRLNGSYEWQTKSAPGSGSRINSYEVGLNTSLTFPRILFPRLNRRQWNYPATTTFNLSADLLNRARFFRMLSFGGNLTYDFKPTQVSTHSITPFKLTFNVLQSTTHAFDSIIDQNKALAQSMENQFIPSMNYTYTYDDGQLRRRTNRFWWQSSFTSAGNITSAVCALFGKGFDEEKKLFGATMAQFVKLTSEIRYTWNIDRNQSLATRFFGGIIYAYGAKNIAPYTEQFYVGGANSIRAYTIRTIGPGSYQPDSIGRYDYLDRTGDIRLEANVEYRFRIIKDLHGAVFLDAGNVWTVRNLPERPGGKFTFNNFFDNLAIGTGVGLRYDLTYLVIRLDCGIGLHVPYQTSRSGFYNIPSFKDGLGLHLAVGYPF